MYHEIGGKPAPKDPALVRTVEAFKKDLELLYAAGFRPVNMSDVANNRIDIEAGKSPVVLTFDDARESQFRLVETDKELKIDPNCGVGILKAFPSSTPTGR
jgi:peptidoglycan/xylan/chitin deacetylase (PgdA/CDA1 family)